MLVQRVGDQVVVGDDRRDGRHGAQRSHRYWPFGGAHLRVPDLVAVAGLSVVRPDGAETALLNERNGQRLAEVASSGMVWLWIRRSYTAYRGLTGGRD